MEQHALVPAPLSPQAFSFDAMCYVEWCHYEMGMTGHGPTAFDVKPTVEKPDLPPHVARFIDGLFAEEAAFRRKAFAEAVYEVTGERPEDWEE